MDLKKLTKKQRREFIEECVKEFIKRFPLEYTVIVRQAELKRKTALDKFGSDGAGWEEKWTHTLKMPQRLHDLIDKKVGEPRFLEDKEEVVWFKKTFPEFKASEK